ncbi:MAG TPA: NAD(P)-dependent alcohol dehydrogenase, partial [Polyangiaceae bacterium]|nr:NAD(P)-dependent alcohol dehydrogenase [Polyangiaceae bacterium]
MAQPLFMRSVVRSRYGGPETLSVREVPRPEPKPDQVLIRVAATTVNRTDCGALWGAPYIFRFFVGWPKPRHVATGSDFAGTVEQVGSAVQSFEVGDRVLGFDDECLGSHAQYLVLAAKGPLVKLPESVPLDQAAASIEGTHYALNFCTKVKLEPGVRVVVNGATGAIGSAAVQLLKHFGVRVTAVCATPHVERVAALGAERVIDYTQQDFTQELEPGAFDLVFDAVGKSRFSLCQRLLKPQGAYVSSELGPKAENITLALTTPWAGKQRVIFPFPTAIPRSLKLVSELLQKGELNP